ncbi:MAG: hypothetical protein H0U52_14645 [Chloroflexi bacterium]|nr:hypothetical protein [Chloroflexota bacterium]
MGSSSLGRAAPPGPSPQRTSCRSPSAVVNLVGGGSRNDLLCRLAADAIGRPVVAGPVEATAIGNLLVQARSIGLIDGGLTALRRIVRESQPLKRYEPRARVDASADFVSPR